jgi:hypothetical protein
MVISQNVKNIIHGALVAGYSAAAGAVIQIITTGLHLNLATLETAGTAALAAVLGYTVKLLTVGTSGQAAPSVDVKITDGTASK